MPTGHDKKNCNTIPANHKTPEEIFLPLVGTPDRFISALTTELPAKTDDTHVQLTEPKKRGVFEVVLSVMAI